MKQIIYLTVLAVLKSRKSSRSIISLKMFTSETVSLVSVSIFLVFVNHAIGQKSKVTLYEDADQGGYANEMQVGKSCENLHFFDALTASSVDNHGNCFLLCSLKDCRGRCIRISGQMKDIYNDFEKINFDDLTTSLRECNAASESKEWLTQDFDNEITWDEDVTPEMTLYEHEYFEGRNTKFFVRDDDCIGVPYWFNDLASSAQITAGCVEVCTHYGCEGRCHPLRPRSAGLSDFGDIAFNNDVSSLRKCTGDE